MAAAAFIYIYIFSSRFLMLMLFYAVLGVSHWWVITATTAGTVAFLVAKVGI